MITEMQHSKYYASSSLTSSPFFLILTFVSKIVNKFVCKVLDHKAEKSKEARV